jgi:hypothetical protein
MSHVSNLVEGDPKRSQPRTREIGRKLKDHAI